MQTVSRESLKAEGLRAVAESDAKGPEWASFHQVPDSCSFHGRKAASGARFSKHETELRSGWCRLPPFGKVARFGAFLSATSFCL